uniref:Interleukin-1 n=1 Tax=Molossus molossus TaxID=27622 RepID=A0A7J8E234_MOLMO|nr:interleukin 37 [Molossus molossus]
MSCLEENAQARMDSGDWERADPQCGAEEPARGPLEPGLSLPALSSAHTGPRVANQKPQRFTFHDQDHKVLVLDAKKLIAVQNKSYILPATFFVSACHLSSACEKQGSPVFLAVSKEELFLCCDMDKTKSQPTLRLKEKKLSQLLSAKGDLKSFAFYRIKVGCRNLLESAAHTGWFLSTASSGEPVTMTQKPGRKQYTEFSFIPVHKVESCPSEVSE